MAAGLGYIEFTTGDVLTAASANGYLASQVVMVFASSAARTSAIASPQEGMFSYLKDTNSTEYYSGSAWVAIGGGGLSSPLTTKGDVWGYSTTNARVPVGTNGQILTADSTEATGVKWATPASGSGLTLVNTYTLSAAASQTMDNVFTSTYDNYYMLINVNTTTTDLITLRWRASGADTTTGYQTQELGAANTTLFGQRLTTGQIGAGGASERMTITLTITAPNLVQETQALSTCLQNVSGDTSILNYAVNQSATTQFDGIKILTAAGTMTGTISVYGYAK